jgi:hypothetical protein
MNDDFLKNYYKPPRKQFAADLYQRIFAPMETQPRFLNLQRVLLASAVVFAVLVVTLVVSPPARAFASQLFRQIGVFTLVDNTGEQSPADPDLYSPTTEPPTADMAQKAPDAAGASELASFTVYSPSDLPAGYKLTGDWSLMDQGNGKVVVSEYRDAEGHYLLLNQYHYGEGDHFEQSYADNEQVTDVIVRGQAGVWIEGRLVGDSPDVLVPTVWLMWEEGGVNYTLFSDALSQEAMMRAAESLE